VHGLPGRHGGRYLGEAVKVGRGYVLLCFPGLIFLALGRLESVVKFVCSEGRGVDLSHHHDRQERVQALNHAFDTSHTRMTTLDKPLDTTRTISACLLYRTIPPYPFICHKPQVSLRPPPPPHTSTMAGAARRSPLPLLALIIVFLALAAQAFVVPKTSLKGNFCLLLPRRDS